MSTDNPRDRDAEQMARVAQGDHEFFAELHRVHYPTVFRIALATVLDRQEAQDVAQEVFVRLHRVAPRWEPRALVRTWLHRTTVNVALSARRRVARWLRPRPTTPAPSHDPETVAVANSLHQRVREELAQLSARQRAVTTLHLDAELSPSEIAEQLGITANAARVTLHKGLARLRNACDSERIPGPVESKEPSR